MSSEKTSLIQDVTDLVLREVNVKELEFMNEDDNILVKEIKPDFKKLGPRFGKQMKAVAAAVNAFDQSDISALEKEGNATLLLDGQEVEITTDDVLITTKDVPGWLVSSDGDLTVALDFTITDELKDEGIAREFVNRIQNLRKDSGLEVTDKIALQIENHSEIERAIKNNLDYICAETLAGSLELVSEISGDSAKEVEVESGVETKIALQKI